MSGAPAPSVSIVIPTYNRRHALPDLLMAAGADPYPIEIIVVVDGCADGSLEYVQGLAAADPRFRAIWQENTGEAGARQAGAQAATGEVILFLDDDVVPRSPIAYGHALHHAGRSDLVVLGYMPTRRPSTPAPDSFTTDLYAEEYERVCDEYRRTPEAVLLGLWAGNMSLTRDNVRRIGMVSGERLHYHPDQEFGLRCKAAGLSGRFDEGLAVDHVHRRGITAFLRDAHNAGYARRRLELGFPEFGLRLDPGLGVPSALRPVVGVLASRWPGSVARAGLRTLASAGARTGRYGIERASARLLRQAELRRGYHSADGRKE